MLLYFLKPAQGYYSGIHPLSALSLFFPHSTEYSLLNIPFSIAFSLLFLPPWKKERKPLLTLIPILVNSIVSFSLLQNVLISLIALISLLHPHLNLLQLSLHQHDPSENALVKVTLELHVAKSSGYSLSSSYLKSQQHLTHSCSRSSVGKFFSSWLPEYYTCLVFLLPFKMLLLNLFSPCFLISSSPEY